MVKVTSYLYAFINNKLLCVSTDPPNPLLTLLKIVKLFKDRIAAGEELPNLRFASCSCDNQVYEWVFENKDWKRYVKPLNLHLICLYVL